MTCHCLATMCLDDVILFFLCPYPFSLAGFFPSYVSLLQLIGNISIIAVILIFPMSCHWFSPSFTILPYILCLPVCELLGCFYCHIFPHLEAHGFLLRMLEGQSFSVQSLQFACGIFPAVYHLLWLTICLVWPPVILKVCLGNGIFLAFEPAGLIYFVSSWVLDLVSSLVADTGSSRGVLSMTLVGALRIFVFGLFSGLWDLLDDL